MNARAWIVWGTHWIDLGNAVRFTIRQAPSGWLMYDAHWQWSAYTPVHVEFVVTEINGTTSFRRMPQPSRLVPGDTLDLSIADMVPL